MTKIKNTKKGMAKKTLSMSLVVAMLATSNVPVWAAEFSDGTDANTVVTAETPAVEEFSDNAVEAEAPVVEDTATVAANAAEDVNTEGYTMKNLKITAGAWGTAVSVEGSIKKDGTDVTGLKYTWLADGVQAAGTDAAGTSATYTPVKEDFNKELSVRIYKEDTNGAVVFSKTITGGKVKPYELKSSTVPSFTSLSTEYTGKEIKLVPSNASVFQFTSSGRDIHSNQIAWTYTTKGNGFTNVTGKEITVIGELQGTYDKNSTAYGYTFTSVAGTYEVTPKKLKASNLELELKKTSIPFTGVITVNEDNYYFGINDITLNVIMDDDSRIDITAALENDIKGFRSDSGTVGKDKTLSTRAYYIARILSNTDEAKEILKNFDFTGSDFIKSSTNKIYVNSKNTYEVTILDLSKCTGEVTTDYLVDAFKANPKVEASDIKLVTPEGKELTVNKLGVGTNVNVTVSKAAVDAAKNGVVGVVQDAVTITYATDTQNVTGSISLPINLTTKSLSSAKVNVGTNVGTIELNSTKPEAGTAAYKVTYDGKACDLTEKTGFKVTVGGTELQTGEYDVSYDDNVNAGIVTVTITGKGSYTGSSKKVYFEIEKAEVNQLKAETSVTVNPENNYDASLYKDALKLKLDATLGANNKVVLEEGKDYTVKYYFAKSSGLTTEADIKADAGTNNVGKYVYAVVTLAKDGNYKADPATKLIASSQIVNKSISGVSITLDKDAYTFTGKEIIPTVTVKDGNVTLQRDVDYTITVKNAVNVGTATVTIKPTAGSDYSVDTVATTTFKIEAAKAEDVKVTFEAAPYNYTGRQIRPVIDKVTLNGVDVTDDFDITYPTYGENVNAGKDAGSVTIAPKKATENFTGTKTQLFDIEGIKLEGTLAAYYDDKTKVATSSNNVVVDKNGKDYSLRYDGTAQTFASTSFTATTKGDLTEGKDYEIKYINNVNAGYGLIVVIARGNYVGEKSISGWTDYTLTSGKLTDKNNTVLATNVVDILAFRIESSVFTAKNITVSNGVYAGGLAVKPEVTVKVNGTTLVEGTDYTLELESIDGKTSADQFTNVTTGKPYRVTVAPKGGYTFDTVNGTNVYVWGIDKKDLKDCFVKVSKNKEALDLTVMNGNVVETAENFDVKDNGDGTATVTVVDGGKNYTGSATVTIEDPNETGAVGTAMITDVKVAGNKATVVLGGEVENATGYDYVIATEEDYMNGRVDITKNQVKTAGNFTYVQEGTYYAYCHAWKRGADGKKVFGEWSNLYKFEVTAKTPSQPVITSVKVKGSDVTVTYTKSSLAKGYDVVLGTASKKVNGEVRPVEYGTLVKKNIDADTVSVTFKDVEAGTYYVGLHAFNRTSADNTKVFSKWSNVKKVTVK